VPSANLLSRPFFCVHSLHWSFNEFYSFLDEPNCSYRLFSFQIYEKTARNFSTNKNGHNNWANLFEMNSISNLISGEIQYIYHIAANLANIFIPANSEMNLMSRRLGAFLIPLNSVEVR